MAKGKRTTTSKARRASVANVTKATATICRLEDKAHAEVFGLQHLAALMALMAEHVGGPGKDWSDMEMQEIGNRIEYLGGLVRRHADVTSDTLGEMRSTAERLQWGAQ